MMDKRIIAVLAVAFLALAGYAIVQKSDGAGFLGASYTVLNVDKIEYTTSDNMWSILLSQGRGGDILYATLKPDDGDRIKEPGEMIDIKGQGSARYPVEITLTPQKETCVYPIRSISNTGKIVKYTASYYTNYKLSSVAGDYLSSLIKLLSNNGLILKSVIDDCMAKGRAASLDPRDYYVGITYDESRMDLGSYPFCVYPYVVGRVGTAEPKLTFETKLGVKVNGIEKTGTVSNTNACSGGETCSQAASIGNYGTAFWYGSLITGDFCPSFGNQEIIPAYLPVWYWMKTSTQLEAVDITLKRWATYNNRISALTLISNHQLKIEPQLGGDFQYQGGTGVNFVPKIMKSNNGNLYVFVGGGNYDNWFNTQVIRQDPWVYNGREVRSSSTPTSAGSVDETNGVITVVATPGTFMYPQFKLEIDGNILPIDKWVVEPQYCKPKIEVLSSNIVVYGTGGTPIRFRATNLAGGSNECVMTASVICKTGYSSPVPKMLGTFESGEAKEFELDVSCAVDAARADSCTVTLTGGRKENAQITLQSTCEVETECTPNTEYCEGNYKITCDSSGKKTKPIYCDECRVVGDKAECISRTKETICDDGIDNDGDGKIDCEDEDCRNAPECAIPPHWDSWMFAAMVAVLFGILTFSAVYSYRKKPKNKFALSILGAVIVGVIVFVAVNAMNLPIENPFDLIRPNIQACSCPDCWLPFDVWGCELANVVEGIKYLICLGIGVIAGFLLYKTLANLPEFRDKMLMVLTLVGISALIVFIIALALFWFAVVVLVIFAFFKWVMSPLALVGKIGGLVSKAKK